MKRLFSLLLTLALALTLAAGAAAAASAQLTRAFVYQDTLYTYVNLTGTDQPVTKANAEIQGRTIPASGTLQTVRQAGFPVTWMLLVDNSNSMPPFREEVVAFAEGLAATCGENTRFLLATFGDAFTLTAEDVPADQLAAEMAAIPMDETVTRLHSSMDQALDAFDAIPRQGEELRGLIVLSDAVQYDPQASVSYEELLERINASDVMVHSVGFGTDAAALESLSALTEASGGTHQVVGADRTAAEAAAALAEETGSLYVTSFALSSLLPEGGTERVSVTFASDGELLCRAEADVAFPAAEGETEAPEQTPAADPSVEPVPETEPPAAGADPETPEDSSAPLWIVGVVVLVVAAAAAVVWLRSRKRTSPPSAPAAEPAPAPVPEPAAEPAAEAPGVYMRLEVLQGTPVRPLTEWNLTGELVVGRDPACDLVFDDPSLSRRHARIFVGEDGRVCLEDLASQNGTQVNGAPVEGTATLRSGDEITVGDAAFRLKF